MAYFPTREPKCVDAEFAGACPVGDVQLAFEKISGDSRCDGIRYAVFDCPEVERQNMSEAEIEMVAAFDIELAHSLPFPRFASVTADASMLTYGNIFSISITLRDPHLFVNFDKRTGLYGHPRVTPRAHSAAAQRQSAQESLIVNNRAVTVDM